MRQRIETERATGIIENITLLRKLKKFLIHKMHNWRRKSLYCYPFPVLFPRLLSHYFGWRLPAV